jgi:uncharacterized protein YndB with AHSA1/START domain
MDTFACRHISITIRRPPDDVYAFAVSPENLPRWAMGLSGSIRQIDGEWVADSPMGKVKVRFVPRNPFGVLDHDVILESGITVRNPMRVVANGDGSELTFTVFKRPEMTEEEFTADAGAVTRDLEALKALLEAAQD